MKVQARRVQNLERKIRRVDAEVWINRCLKDPEFLVEHLKLHPARPGSPQAAISAELLELVPWIRAGGMEPPLPGGRKPVFCVP